MPTTDPAWYCVRTKPKHEHIAAARLSQGPAFEVFHPRLRVERATRRGMVRVIESLFPCYLFVHCVIADQLDEIRYTNGVTTIVHFAHRIPAVPDSIIHELQACFAADEPMLVNDGLSAGAEVVLADGAFRGMSAVVLRVMPARRRVQVLLDILGRTTATEVDRGSLTLVRNVVADRVPLLAAAYPRMAEV
jgi:transcriptional antiterminator RfaH